VQISRLEDLLEVCHQAGLLDRHEELTVCTLFRRRHRLSAADQRIDKEGLEAWSTA